eukprot:CAMPEP_0182452848 /NCGR_PEP_ID=MMETSP1319-20130603/169_1 /TAXON_ID=172717 /ORGANISM="Bolidomonas pacifica, Strain RCC208" /LENGTH=146 /DNA_ID=CAMNT_0024650725 /DNA_START=127 /DNA_END=564 /DNA_ORIENTATION=-
MVYKAAGFIGVLKTVIVAAFTDPASIEHCTSELCSDITDIFNRVFTECSVAACTEYGEAAGLYVANIANERYDFCEIYLSGGYMMLEHTENVVFYEFQDDDEPSNDYSCLIIDGVPDGECILTFDDAPSRAVVQDFERVNACRAKR